MDSRATFSVGADVWTQRPDWPPQIYVFAKSLHVLAAAWIVTAVFLWMSVPAHPTDGTSVFIHAILPALGIEGLAFAIGQWTNAMGGSLHARAHEWGSALAWASVPIVLLIGTALAMTR